MSAPKSERIWVPKGSSMSCSTARMRTPLRGATVLVSLVSGGHRGGAADLLLGRGRGLRPAARREGDTPQRAMRTVTAHVAARMLQRQVVPDHQVVVAPDVFVDVVRAVDVARQLVEQRVALRGRHVEDAVGGQPGD